MRVLELFSGIGAVAIAAGSEHEIVCAIDISQPAMHVYQANFSSPTVVKEINSLATEEIARFDADLWWMSPSCQPFTRRGLKKDLEDSRTKPLLRLIRAIDELRPANVALENVIGFGESQTYRLLSETLHSRGYFVATSKLCSTEFGLPNLRPRFFLAASRNSKPRLSAVAGHRRKQSVEHFLDNQINLAWRDSLHVDSRQISKYRQAINIADRKSEVTRCFTSAYGRSIVRSGSYLATDQGVRRFSPTEIARLLGFPAEYRFPEYFSAIQLWKLLGNTVSVPCANHVIASFQ